MALQNAHDPLSAICSLPAAGAAAGDVTLPALFGLVPAGVDAVLAAWTAFEKSWHAEWLALAAAEPSGAASQYVSCPAGRCLLTQKATGTLHRDVLK